MLAIKGQVSVHVPTSDGPCYAGKMWQTGLSVASEFPQLSRLSATQVRCYIVSDTESSAIFWLAQVLHEVLLEVVFWRWALNLNFSQWPYSKRALEK